MLAFSCSNKSELSKSFNCETSEIKNDKEYLDFKNNFKLKLPSTWKTNKYYSEFQSEIFSADTTKQLSESFIFDASYNFGNLKLDADYVKKTDSVLRMNNLEKIKSGQILFQNKPALWYVVKGKKNGFPYHQFNLMVENTETTYFSVYSEIYGDKNIEERICESISIIDKIEFLQ